MGANMTAAELVELYMADLLSLDAEIAKREEGAARLIETAKRVFDATGLKSERETKDKELKKLLRANAEAIFGDGDKAELVNGVAFRADAEKVVIPRDAVEKIEAEGWTEGLKIETKLKREVVETWPDERLTVIGARRKPVVEYSYELKEEAQ